MPRLDQRRRGPRRRQTGAEPVTNPFEALFLVYPGDPVPEDEHTPAHRARVESARRLLNRDRLTRARRTLQEPEPKEDFLRERYGRNQAEAREWVTYSEDHPEDFWVEAAP